jgi:hypothetical protein
MDFWKWLWSLLWFGGLGLFAFLSVVITIQGAADLKALLQGLREAPPDSESEQVSR